LGSVSQALRPTATAGADVKSFSASAPESRNGVRNALLRELPLDEFRRLREQMQDVTLDFKQRIYEQDGPVKDSYFPNTGVVSIVVELSDGAVIEAGTVGYEGMTGVPAALAAGPSPGAAFVQIAGQGLRLPVSVLVAEQNRAESPLLKLVRAYLNYLVAMLGQSAACNRMHTVESRMARWLLMTHDRVEDDEFPLTQEFLGMLERAAADGQHCRRRAATRRLHQIHARADYGVEPRAAREQRLRVLRAPAAATRAYVGIGDPQLTSARRRVSTRRSSRPTAVFAPPAGPTSSC
jgi:CRP-like cAMP-binding protein